MLDLLTTLVLGSYVWTTAVGLGLFKLFLTLAKEVRNSHRHHLEEIDKRLDRLERPWRPN